jgi:hypothetical protein
MMQYESCSPERSELDPHSTGDSDLPLAVQPEPAPNRRTPRYIVPPQRAAHDQSRSTAARDALGLLVLLATLPGALGQSASDRKQELDDTSVATHEPSKPSADDRCLQWRMTCNGRMRIGCADELGTVAELLGAVPPTDTSCSFEAAAPVPSSQSHAAPFGASSWARGGAFNPRPPPFESMPPASPPALPSQPLPTRLGMDVADPTASNEKLLAHEPKDQLRIPRRTQSAGAPSPPGLCDNTCVHVGDGACDDGGPRAHYTNCNLGTDCRDCGSRIQPCE